jgi:aminopeptidase-like protein
MTASEPRLDRDDLTTIGQELHRFAAELYPICRSITGNGLRATLKKIQEIVPLEIREIPSGTKVFDWEVPKEWNIRDAYVKNQSGRKVIDFQEHSLHILNYSVPMQARLSLSELRTHLHSIPQHPDWIPYRTSYYKPDWGFCLRHRELQALEEGEYEVCVDSSLEDGHLSYGEIALPGESSDEVLISVHACHPSLANDNLSGVTVAAFLARLLRKKKLRYSYRFVFIPGTIGAITWLATNQDNAKRVRHGLVLTCIGDAGGFHYKKSRRGDAEIDRAMAHVLKHCGESFEVLEFSPYGYDERQYCSPGFNLPVGCLMRSVWGTFPEYHTSADNLEFIRAEKLAHSLRVCTQAIEVLEGNRSYQDQNPYCEPQLGKRGLYGSRGGQAIPEEIHARLWVLNLSDGRHSLLEIAERAGLPFWAIREAANVLLEGGLLAEVVAVS